MSQSNELCETLLICGNLTKNTKKFNEQTKIEQIREYISQAFDTSLPKAYRIVYYDATTMSFVNLEEQLRNGLNPFQVNGSTGVQSTTNIIGCTQLYVVSNIRSQSENEDDQIVSDGIEDDISTEANICENDLLTNDETSHDLSSINEDRSLMINPPSIKPQDIQNIPSRLIFSLDVKPNQKDIYKSDQFSIRTGQATGRIARVQGIKRDDQKMLQVLPKLRTPSIYLQSNGTLLVAVVSEEISNGMRIWYKHPDKGFLPEGYEKDTIPINPIQFNLDQIKLTTEGDFALSLQMITKWDKSKKEREEFYRYDNQKTMELHTALHDSRYPRLFCVLRRNGETNWETFCLSDFIRPSRPPKKRSSSVTKGNTHSPERKRLKRND